MVSPFSFPTSIEVNELFLGSVETLPLRSEDQEGHPLLEEEAGRREGEEGEVRS